MRKLILSCIWMCVCGHLGAQVSSAENMPRHPRLFLHKGEEAQIVNRLQKDVNLLKVHNYIMDKCTWILDAQLSEPKKDASGVRILQVSRENMRRIFYLSYAYRITGEKKYAARAEREMLSIADYPSWNPSHYLDVAEMTMAMAVGYDWLYNVLPEVSRRKIAQAIIEKGIKPSYPSSGKVLGWVKGKNNWNQVCNTGMAIGALAVFEEDKPLCVQTINRAIEGVPSSMSGYAPDGAYPEGITYWNYGTTYNVFLIHALKRIYNSDFGLSQMPGFISGGLYSQQMITPSLRHYNYGDTKPDVTFNPAAFWFYSQTKDPALLYMQKRIIEEKEIQDPEIDRFIPAALVWSALAKVSLSQLPMPSSLSWMGRGENPVAVFRSSWSDPNGLYVGVKGGSSAVSHGHQDAGSFYFESDGIPWALELGQENYSRIEAAGVQIWGSQRWDVFRYNNFNHNVITINGRPHTAEKAEITDYYETVDRMGATVGLTPVYDKLLAKYDRKISVKNKKCVTIEENITTLNQFTKIRWNMATAAQTLESVNDSAFVLKKGDKLLYMVVSGVKNMRWVTRNAKSENDYDSPNPGVQFIAFDAVLPMNTEQKITITLSPHTLP